MCEPTKCNADENNNQNSICPVGQNLSNVRSMSFQERPFICSYDDCTKSYTTSSHLKRHEEIHEKAYRCTEKKCKKIFISKSTLKKHVDNVHLKKKPKKYKCSICDQDFNKRSWLTRHQFRHTGVKPYACSEEGCEKRFLFPSKLRRHLKVHEGYTCTKENCGKKFPTWTLYVKHVKTSHPTIHRCHYCEKVFLTSNNLKAHSEVHELDREVYLCPKPNCSRFYTMERNLKYHLKTYHEKRPFVCNEEHCYKAFKSEKDLNAHASRHDPKKRVRKKKKSNSKPSFAARLAGCVPRKVTKHNTKDEVLEENLINSKGKVQTIHHTSPERNNQEVPNLNSTGDNVSTCDMDDRIQTVLNMQETILERKSFHPESTICVSA